MIEILNLLLVFISGLVLGALFFGGLWFTVKKAIPSKTPAFWFLASFISRISIVLISFYYLSRASLQWLLVGFLGSITARFIVIRITKMYDKNQLQLKKEEANHES